VAVGDFNGDGKLDLAVANASSNNVSVLLGNGTGGFGAATNYAVGAPPHSVAVGDFNGDGTLDLAVGNNGSNNVSVLLGNGTGGFGTATNYAAGSSPHSVAVGDFNGDGKPDLAVANQNSNNVSVLLGNGNGTFGPAINYAVVTTPESVAVGDFNGDGKPDLAVANGGSGVSVSVLLGNGDGTFGAATDYAVGTRPVSVAVGDFNGDGGPDLAVANFYSNNVSVLLNQAPLPRTTMASSGPNPSVYGQLITLTATVTADESASAAPTGAVAFKDGNTILGTGTLDGSGHASLSTFSLGAGYHALTAVYLGDPHHATSSSAVLNQLVNQDATTSTLGVSGNPVVDLPVTLPLTLTATVTGLAPGFGPTGSVLFLDGATAIGAGTLYGGIATFTTAVLAPGDHFLTAVYVGDNNHTGSTSLQQPVTIIGAPLKAAFGRTLFVTGHKNFRGVVAIFTSGIPNATKADFTAIITWDNGSSTKGLINGTGPFLVYGSHTFGAFTGAHKITVTIFAGSTTTTGEDLALSGSTVTVTDNVIDPPGPPDGVKTRVVRRDGRWLVRVFDAATGRLRGTLHPFGPAASRPRVLLRDVDGDDVADLVIVARVGGALRKKAFDALDLSPLPVA
jgi:hypothetical protein